MEMCEHSQHSKKANHGSLEDVQLLSTSRPFAQWNSFSSTCNIPKHCL